MKPNKIINRFKDETKTKHKKTQHCSICEQPIDLEYGHLVVTPTNTLSLFAPLKPQYLHIPCYNNLFVNIVATPKNNPTTK